MSYNGYLIKLIAVDGTKTEISPEYMRYDTYQITPDQRLDLDTGLRDLTGVMHRVVVQHTATKIEFNTPMMDSVKFDALINLLMSHVRNYWERDVWLEYYDPETRGYKTGHFYIPDDPYKIRNVDVANRIVNYNEFRVAFIEY